LILRGIKTAELRSRGTTIIGQRFYIYASKAKAKRPIWSDDLRVATPPKWMLELAEQVKLIEEVTPPDAADPAALFHWHLTDVQRAKKFRKPRLHPQPVWFNPF
jgi:hypothetical protein